MNKIQQKHQWNIGGASRTLGENKDFHKFQIPYDQFITLSRPN